MPANNLLTDLRTALRVLERDRKAMVDCCSQIEEIDGEYVAIPGTLEEDAKDDVAEYDRAIAAVREAIKMSEGR